METKFAPSWPRLLLGRVDPGDTVASERAQEEDAAIDRSAAIAIAMAQSAIQIATEAGHFSELDENVRAAWGWPLVEDKEILSAWCQRHGSEWATAEAFELIRAIASAANATTAGEIIDALYVYSKKNLDTVVSCFFEVQEMKQRGNENVTDKSLDKTALDDTLSRR